MEHWYNPLTWPAGGWSALAAWAAVIVAVTAAILVRRQLEEARELRRAQARPYVMVDFERDAEVKQGILLVIQNFGTSAGYDVTFAFDPPLAVSPQQQAANLIDSKLLTNGIPTLPPGKRFVTVFDWMPDRKETSLPESYAVTVSYADTTGRAYTDKYTLDLGWLADATWFDRKGLHEIAKGIEDLASSSKSAPKTFRNPPSF
ncbi:MAG TPA: hypothetical protein VJ846_08645 [Sphingomicrobium sp.]|nr:hypothetical protein [Sphingomicrobium sp.]